MVFKQYYLNCLAHASYLVADEGARVAAIVDPQRDVDRYIEDARQQGFEIRYVFLTHAHADFIAGHLELRERVGASIYLGARAKAEYPFTPMSDGDVVRLGAEVTLQVLETPGHTAESICIAVFGSPADAPASPDAAEPRAVLTGDTLFVGDVGRPDLHASLGWAPEDLAALLYDSLHGKLLALPDATRVYPAHGAGSLCGKALGSESFSTIGIQRHLNYALQPMSKDEFIRMIVADQPDAPSYFPYDAVLNTKERPTLDQALEKSMRALGVGAVMQHQREGAQLLDVRDGPFYEAAHLAGSLNIGLGGQYATWAGTMLDREHPIVVIAEPGREYEAVMRLGRIGFDRVAGYLADGMLALAGRPDLVAATERVSPEELAEELHQPAPPFVLDVRAPRECGQNRIAGSVNIPLNHLRARLAEVPRNRRVVVHCAAGYRSAIAASLLEHAGFEDLADLAGGMQAWVALEHARV
jgi:glyoxylase-like metal-dependent hydrolase (beta-lactamase superfamily II)/rhodanese-related sulfurtransferase